MQQTKRKRKKLHEKEKMECWCKECKECKQMKNGVVDWRLRRKSIPDNKQHNPMMGKEIKEGKPALLSDFLIPQKEIMMHIKCESFICRYHDEVIHTGLHVQFPERRNHLG
jgi:hypothetical protein